MGLSNRLPRFRNSNLAKPLGIQSTSASLDSFTGTYASSRLLKKGGGAAWLVPRAHGTPTMKQWSFDVRSWRPSQATP